MKRLCASLKRPETLAAGITLGVSQNTSTVTALVIALLFHQGNEGLALGCLFVKAGHGKLRYLMLALAFVIVTPLGVAIGRHRFVSICKLPR